MIAVIIVDYCCEALTRAALGSLVRLGRDDLHFIVVDNGLSIDGSAMEHEFPGLSVLRPASNGGFAAGCNLGMAKAAEEGMAWYLLLNPDTRAESDFIEPMLTAMAGDPRLGIVAPTILEDDDERRVTDGGGVVNWWAGSPKGITGRRLQSDGPLVEVPFATGAAMLIRSEAVSQVGPMDEGYFLYFEDSDYCQAFIRRGWKIGYLPQAELLHATSSVAGRSSERYLYYFARNRMRFMRRWARWYHRLVFILFNSLVRLPAMIALYGLVRRRPAAAAAILRGFLDGIKGNSGPMPGYSD